MKLHSWIARGWAILLMVAVSAWSQPARVPAAATVRIETEPLNLLTTERFLTPAVIEPIKRVTLIAPEEGFVQSISAKVGDQVRQRQDLLALDHYEASARLKIAEAEVKEQEAAVRAAPATAAVSQARLDAARARVELAQLVLANRTIKAPFAGRLLSLSVSTGQFVTKGTVLGELADLSGFHVLVPVDRTKVKQGETLELDCEGRTVSGKVLALVPLPESSVHLRELAIPWSAAWVSLDSAGAATEPGERVWSAFLPRLPVAVVSTRALREKKSSVQVLRNERVVTIPVRVLGSFGTDRTQILRGVAHRGRGDRGRLRSLGRRHLRAFHGGRHHGHGGNDASRRERAARRRQRDRAVGRGLESRDAGAERGSDRRADSAAPRTATPAPNRSNPATKPAATKGAIVPF